MSDNNNTCIHHTPISEPQVALSREGWVVIFQESADENVALL